MSFCGVLVCLAREDPAFNELQACFDHVRWRHLTKRRSRISEGEQQWEG